jgi:hypothetical protein
MTNERLPGLKREVKRFRRYALALTSLALLSVFSFATGAFVVAHDVRPASTFRTGALIVDTTATVGGSLIETRAGDPNGAVTGAEGSLVMDSTTPALWQNTNGATAWTKIGGFTTGSSVYYGDGSDGTITFDCVTTPVAGATLSGSTYTLARDIAPLNMTVNGGCTVATRNFRVFVLNTLTNNGTIMNSGDAAVGRPGGNCGGVSTKFYAACAGSGGSGTNGPGAGTDGDANSVAIPQWPAQATTAPGAAGGGHGQGGGGGSTGANAGGGGGSIANPSVNAGLFTAVSSFAGKFDGSGGAVSPWGTGGGGGGCVGGSCTGGGGGGGGGIVFVGANQCLGTGVIAARGGNGGNGALVGGTGAGGGGGGGGGVVSLIYSHRSAGCTTSVTGGTGGTPAGTGAAGGNGSSGTALTYNLSGDGS